MTLIANPNFFRKNKQNQQLPFVDTIIVSFITSPPKELLLFERGKLDIVTNVDGKYVTGFLDKHIEQFQNNPPYYIMKQTTDANKNLKYSFIRSNIQNIEINSIGYFDLTEIFFKNPSVQEISVY
jgi:ABC-type transport system substrate-binding protein